MKNLIKDLMKIGENSGLLKLGFASADDFTSTLKALEFRKQENYSDKMNFTYKNPKRSTSPKATLPSAKSLIVGAYSYDELAGENKSQPTDSVSVARYAQNNYYDKLRLALNKIADRLKEAGYKAVVLSDDNALVDRAAAYRAGIGWYGKNSNLIIPEKGSWFVLGAVLTNANFQNYFAAEPEEDGCGSCQKCITECPTDAILEGGIVDARKCLAWLLQKEGVFPSQYRVALGNRIYGCDDCQTSCPQNYKFSKTQIVGTSPPSVFEILESSDEELLSEFGHFYIPRRDPKYIKRNALIVLGNIGDSKDSRLRPILQKYLSSDDEILCIHAIWAAKRLGQLDLLEPLADNANELIIEELAAK